MSLPVCWLAAALAASAPASAPPVPYILDARPVKQVTGTYRAELRTTGEGNLTAVRLYFGLPDTPGQTNGKITVALPTGTGVEVKQIKELSVLHRPVTEVALSGPALSKAIPIQVTFETTLIARRLVPRTASRKPPAVAPLPDEEEKFYTAETKLYDYTAPEFVAWLDKHKLRKGPKESDLAFATRAFLLLPRLYQSELTKLQPASQLCNLPKLDCDTLSAVYVSALRANAVPARMVGGFPASNRGLPKEGGDHIIGHAVAEFFIQGVGWVPCDPRAGVDHKAKPLDHFGTSSGGLVAFKVDVDMELPVWSADKPALRNTLPVQFWRFKGKPEVKYVEQDWAVAAKPAK